MPESLTFRLNVHRVEVVPGSGPAEKRSDQVSPASDHRTETPAGQTNRQNGSLARPAGYALERHSETGQAILGPEPEPDILLRPAAQEDHTACLPFSTFNEYRRGEAIYVHGQPATSVYLVMEGKVKILRQERLPVLVDIYRSNEFFGESVLAGPAPRMEDAVAMEPTAVMSWPMEEIEAIAASRPDFAFTLIRLVVARSLEFADRIESFSIDGAGQRLVRALIRFGARFGKEAGDGTVKIDAFTHALLSQHIGTTREIVTQHMSRLRRDGLIRYSRQGIFIQPHALTQWRTAQSPTPSNNRRPEWPEQAPMVVTAAARFAV